MSRKPQSTHWDSMQYERLHREKMLAKVQKIDMLRTLLAMWEENPNHDHAYMLELRAKLRTAEQNLSAMSL